MESPEGLFPFFGYIFDVGLGEILCTLHIFSDFLIMCGTDDVAKGYGVVDIEFPSRIIG